jgi:steroid 5-alpha reductase family enzyme
MDRLQRSRAAGRAQSLWVCLGAYLAAAAVGQLAAWAVHGRHPILVAGAADLAATLVVFLFSLAFNNSSLYDPYWSVVPPFLALYWLLRAGAGGIPARQLVVLALLAAWAIRLTANWLRRWRGLAYEDWRYAAYRRAGAAYWPISFFGFHLMPTVLVFLGCLPLLPALSSGGRRFGALDVAAAVVTSTAVAVEGLSDRQLARFLRDARPGQILDTGLWALSRHPNYFGEVLFWWGLWLFGLAAAPAWAWTVVGPAAITALFLGISIPMMDRHLLEHRPHYAEHRRLRSAFLPWFPRAVRKAPDLGED